ncbi:asparagine synthetase domain-containing protein 1 [Leptopilina heterotoma]|uniref:asparagine synthetase domain-containing protein 1 n=1 Tax=Leptopilina heterotoma TaxID=63436 RepID=UPI001CA948FB|nr:asparagine synthetase domain-containing protein 1 [Leptopilina heterotoma]
MCGIFCCLHNSQSDELPLEWNICKERISSRGPDSLCEKQIKLSEKHCLHFAASILWTQGSQMTIQPCVDEDDNILLWNGDVFSGNSNDNTESDTTFILRSFKSLNIVPTLKLIKGPYSFVYFNKSQKILYFSRDLFGRHSLLLNFNSINSSLTFTSVTRRKFENTHEIPAIGLFALNLQTFNPSNFSLSCFPWRMPNDSFHEQIRKLENLLNSRIQIEDVIFPSREESLNLVNVDEKYFHVNVDSEKREDIMDLLLKKEEIFQRMEKIERLLKASIETRIKKQPSYCKNCIKLILSQETVKCTHTKIGILFSGGLDSSILAVLADNFVPKTESIDLINVAFEKVNKNPKNQNLGEIYNVPDRKTGRQSLAELETICPDRNWNFVEVNISQEELNIHRSSRISDLIYPLNTILDESLGCALWFASRGIGILNEEPYESPCRILLLGMGADELFGGYMRHRTILRQKGWEALIEELKLELNRISDRNLGRDDRVTSDHGKQARFPYLDENLVEFVQTIPPWERCCPTEKFPCGLGDKLLLRLVARKLNLKNAANFPKRAFQFGSRIANGRENAKDVSNRL